MRRVRWLTSEEKDAAESRCFGQCERVRKNQEFWVRAVVAPVVKV